MAIFHALFMVMLGWLGIGVLYGAIAPFLTRGITFFSAFFYFVSLPFIAISEVFAGRN
jgi:hypothetical protein